MQNARKDLKRVGLRCYAVTGPRGTWIIERERPWRFAVRPDGWPRAPGGKGKLQSMFFQADPFHRLSEARAYAEDKAGIVKPKRIQRRRVKGWRMPAGTIYVGRPTKWGNPIKIGGKDRKTGGVVDRDTAVERYLQLLNTNCLRIIEADIRKELCGHDLACFCPIGYACHADILLEIANS